MNILLRQSKAGIPANVPIEVVGYHFKTTWACDVFAYNVHKSIPSFYVPADKLNARPEYTLPNVDKFLVRNRDMEVVEVLPSEATIERIVYKGG